MGLNRQSSSSQKPSSSLQQNLSRSSSHPKNVAGKQNSSTSHTKNTSRQSREAATSNSGGENFENKKQGGSRKRKSMGTPGPVSKRRSGEGRRGKVLGERN